jgi:hypothetical protein
MGIPSFLSAVKKYSFKPVDMLLCSLHGKEEGEDRHHEVWSLEKDRGWHANQFTTSALMTRTGSSSGIMASPTPL